MSTQIQILALCLALVGSLVIAVALAGVVLEVILAMMCRGLPMPQLERGRGNGKPFSADSQLPGPGVRLSDYHVVVSYRYVLRFFDKRANFRDAHAKTTNRLLHSGRTGDRILQGDD